MADIQFDSQYKEFDKARNALGHQTAGLVGFLIKIFRGHIKAETATNILIVITVVSFTLSAIIFSSIFFSQKNNEKYKPTPISKEIAIKMIRQGFPNTPLEVLEWLPESFYRDDISPDILKKLPSEFVNLIPTKPQ